MEKLIEIHKASCRFDHASGRVVHALNEIDLTIGRGEFVCLLGRSGHGKSTLLRSLAGLNPLTSGWIRVEGELVAGPSSQRGMVFQEDTVFPWMTVRENVEFGLKCQGLPAAERTQIARRWLAAVGLAAFENSWPKELSGGMRKRVAIAAAFAGGAPILLMDEPFGALDYVTRMDLQNLLLDLWQRTRTTIVFVTHDLEEALVLAERILVFSAGRVVEDMTIDLARPRNEEVRARAEAVAITRTILRRLEPNNDVLRVA
ncbi:ABC transporter ATP-binding protein [Ancylobacter sp. A5.8]|uniref:ABC transporter ATP-binding protein n=1 Tax=Ancylobacter gelatini TaxID=2919920 RepID=UPI001F4D933A|nr:ABC transporter ATP-binding protein [Ancylobacter gelatini]MCJ8142342.1 ABC transporter ATP-binding protein [Ancylobacter gelatini]